jgi:hypothetical protein
MNLIINSDDKIIEAEGAFNHIDSPNDDDEDWGSPIEVVLSLFDYFNLSHEEDQAIVEVIPNDNNYDFALGDMSYKYNTIIAIKQYIKREDEYLGKVWSFELDLDEQFVTTSISTEGKVIEYSTLENIY